MTGFTLDRMRFAGGLAVWLVLSTPAVVRAASGPDELLGGDIGNAVFTLIIFLVLVGVLGRFAWKPLLRVLNERERTIRESLEGARSEREQAARLLADYEARLRKAHEEASGIVAEARRDAEAAGRRLHEDARRQAEDVLARARREIQLAADSARKELHDEASELAVRVAARIIHKQLSAADHQALVAESLKEMQAAGNPRMN